MAWNAQRATKKKGSWLTWQKVLPPSQGKRKKGKSLEEMQASVRADIAYVYGGK